MRACLLTWIFFLPMMAAQAQNQPPSPTTAKSFPDRCMGIWEGVMHMYRQGVLKDSVNVLFTVAPKEKDTWTWRTEYLSEKMPMTKDYVLKWKDKDRQIFAVDEGEGLELYDYAIGDKLYSVFETHGVLLTATYELRGDQLIFEVTSGKAASKAHPEVKNYTVDHLQRVVLKRKK